MTVDDGWLADQFEEKRKRLRAVAFRMLGSLADADDAVQETWLRLSRADRGGLENLEAWLTTVIARVCLDMLRSRRVRREEPSAGPVEPPIVPSSVPHDPEQEAQLADSVGLAMLVVLETLEPAERLAFVLHDTFGMPFEEIARVLDRTPAAARQLASRARRRVQGTRATSPADLARQREVVEAFLAASRGGSFDALVALLAPDVVARSDTLVIHGARKVAKAALLVPPSDKAAARLALINGTVGAIVAANGHLTTALCFTIVERHVTELVVLTDRSQLTRLPIAVL